MNSIQKLATVALFERIVVPYADCADSSTEMVDSIVRSCISALKYTYVGKHSILYTSYGTFPEITSRPLREKDIDTTYRFLTSSAYLKGDALTADKVSALLKIEEELRMKRSAKQMLVLERASGLTHRVHGNEVLVAVPVVSNTCSCLA